jgi:hypothetical protein
MVRFVTAVVAILAASPVEAYNFLRNPIPPTESVEEVLIEETVREEHQYRLCL